MKTYDFNSISWLKQNSWRYKYLLIVPLIILLLCDRGNINDGSAFSGFFILVLIFTLMSLSNSKITKVCVDNANRKFICETKSLFFRSKIVTFDLDRVSGIFKTVDGLISESHVLSIYFDKEKLLDLKTKHGFGYDQLKDIADSLMPENC
jgi:hypothetical protein